MNKIVQNKIYLFTFYFFNFSLLLLKLPPFNMLQISSKLSTTHVLAKIILLGIAALLVVIDRSLLMRLVTKRRVFLFIFFYFISSSISIISAENISFFFQQYQNVILGIVIFIISFVLVQKIAIRQIILYLLVVGTGSVLSDALFALFPTEILMILKDSLQTEMYALYTFNLTEKKYNLYLTTEVFVPFFMLYISTRFKKYGGIVTFISISLIGFLSMFSNFRTRLIQFIFSYVSSIYYLNKVFKKTVTLILVLMVLITTLLFVIIRSNTSYDIIDRFVMNDESDTQTIQYRFDTFVQATSMLRLNPIFGVGLGNYKTYINQAKTLGIRDRFFRLHAEETNDNPHSVFVQIITESGFIGIASFIALLLFFLKSDLKVFASPLLRKNTFLFSCIIASWTIFLYGIFNPFNTIFLNGWFWYFRGMIGGIINTNS